MSSSPRVSVVVPTYRRPALLLRCLCALVKQSLARDRYEIVVADDGHCDATRALVEAVGESARPLVVRYLRPSAGKGPAVARNCGWRIASGTLVAFTDDDTVPDAHWLACGEAAMRSAPWVAVAGRVVVPRPPGAHNAPSDHELMTRGLERAEFVTANAFVDRLALERIGGFDEAFARAWREDSDLCFRLQEIGPVGRCEQAVVAHPVRPERWGVSLRQQRNVYFDALLYRKHPRLYRQRVRPIPPWDYYAIVALTGAAVIFGGGGAPGSAAATAGAALALVLRLAARRLRGTSHAPAHVAEMLATSAVIPFLSVYWRVRGAWHFRVPFL